MRTLTSAEQALQDFLQFGTLLGRASPFSPEWDDLRQPWARNDNVPPPASYVPPPLQAPPTNQQQRVDYEKAYVDCFVRCGRSMSRAYSGEGRMPPCSTRNAYASAWRTSHAKAGRRIEPSGAGGPNASFRSHNQWSVDDRRASGAVSATEITGRQTC